MLAGALIRRVGDQGGNATVIAKGDPSAGAILLICLEKGVTQSVIERLLDGRGHYCWTSVGPSAADAVPDYIERRLARDPDLWVVELDIANAKRLAAEMG